MQTVLVLGGSGYLGQFLVQSLTKHYKVDLCSAKHIGNLMLQGLYCELLLHRLASHTTALRRQALMVLNKPFGYAMLHTALNAAFVVTALCLHAGRCIVLDRSASASCMVLLL